MSTLMNCMLSVVLTFFQVGFMAAVIADAGDNHKIQSSMLETATVIGKDGIHRIRVHIEKVAERSLQVNPSVMNVGQSNT